MVCILFILYVLCKEYYIINKPGLRFFSLDPDTANGNATEATKLDSVKEDINKNEKSVKNTKNNSKKAAKMANNDAKHTVVKDMESCENGEDETDKVVNVEQEIPQAQEEAEVPAPVEEPAEEAPVPSVPAVFVPKYKYTDGEFLSFHSIMMQLQILWLWLVGYILIKIIMYRAMVSTKQIWQKVL